MTIEPDRVVDGLCFVLEESVADFRALVSELGDDLVNSVPAVPGVNSAFALTAHLCGVLDYWGATVVGGMDLPRDRDSEFLATGTAAEALANLDRLLEEWPRWWRLALTQGIGDPAAIARYDRRPEEMTPERICQHVLRDVTQHLGHAQVARDVLLAGTPTR